MDISINCKTVYVSANNHRIVTVELSEVEVRDMLSEIDITDAISFYDKDELLKEIGEDAARKYFNIEE